jgi:hypothetical protein
VRDIDAALSASRAAVEQLIDLGERTGAAWTRPPAVGKWSASQIVEHVAMSLEESARVACGEPSKFPRLPRLLQPVVRALFFNRVVKNAAFPKARAARAMHPAAGPPTPAEGRARLDAAHAAFDASCRALASRNVPIETTLFGAVAVADYVRFMEAHTRHHGRQVAGLAEP